MQKTLFQRKPGQRAPGPKVAFNKQVLEEINRKQRQILVHSYLYYKRGTNLITDSEFDKWCKRLVHLQKFHKPEFKKSQYYSDFKNFDGSTGMDLPYMLPNIVSMSEYLLKIKEESKYKWRI